MLRKNPLRSAYLIQADIQHLPFPSNTFDLVYRWEVLHHSWNPLPFVQEMAIVSRKRVVIFEPSRYHPVQLSLALFQKEHRPILRFLKSFLKRLAHEAGLEILVLKRVGWIFPNKTPKFLFPLLRLLPVENPVGISYFMVAYKK